MTPLLAQGLRPDRSFERIYRRHVGDVYRYALAVLRNAADAEDVTQTTFLNAYRAYAAGERPRQPQNWLIAIAHNVCRQRFRQSQRRPQEVEYDENVGDWLEEEDRGPNAEDLRRALSHLAFNQRAALVMRELEGRSYSEIAEILGVSVAAVETLLFRARRALREQLEGALTCAEAERALSLEADGELARAEKGPLRAHLRECPDCAGAARRHRAQRSAWKALGALPLPASVTSLFGGGGTAIGVKAAAVAASAIAAGSLGVAGERHFTNHHPTQSRQPKPVLAPAAPAVADSTGAPVRTAGSSTPAALRHRGVGAGKGHLKNVPRGRAGGDSGAPPAAARASAPGERGRSSDHSSPHRQTPATPGRAHGSRGDATGSGAAKRATGVRSPTHKAGTAAHRPVHKTTARRKPKHPARAKAHGGGKPASAQAGTQAGAEPSGSPAQSSQTSESSQPQAQGGGHGKRNANAVRLPDAQVPQLPADLSQVSGA